MLHTLSALTSPSALESQHPLPALCPKAAHLVRVLHDKKHSVCGAVWSVYGKCAIV